MKLYHAQTREDYDALIDELESKGVKWYSGQKPHEFDGFENHKSETIFEVSDNVICYFSMSFYKNNYNEFELIEYKAEKDVEDLNEDVKDLNEYVKDLNEYVLEIIENLVQATNLKSLYSLQKAKHNLDRLIEKMEVEDDTKI